MKQTFISGFASGFPSGSGDEMKELLQYVTRYRPQDIELEPELKPFVPEYIPAIGDIDAFIKVKHLGFNLLLIYSKTDFSARPEIRNTRSFCAR
jgi:hypothetical protein